MMHIYTCILINSCRLVELVQSELRGLIMIEKGKLAARSDAFVVASE